ncbi:hypothetical protein [Herpetosiphon geysericola]|uniref:hypothetical protein n=1 Tax=Herpetosiphon geysericola TaxID=70996 RepID=UPI00128FA97F|nr:hypothetical protein [Herpetosiphon geysericola]
MNSKNIISIHILCQFILLSMIALIPELGPNLRTLGLLSGPSLLMIYTTDGILIKSYKVFHETLTIRWPIIYIGVWYLIWFTWVFSLKNRNIEILWDISFTSSIVVSILIIIYIIIEGDNKTSPVSMVIITILSFVIGLCLLTIVPSYPIIYRIYKYWGVVEGAIYGLLTGCIVGWVTSWIGRKYRNIP